jgi:transcriptional regulator with XRE-family HTH domain
MKAMKKAARPVSRLGIVLKEVRAAKGLSARKLGLEAGLAPAAVGHYESGRRIPRKNALIALAKALGLPPAVLSWFAHTAQDTGHTSDPILDRVESLMLEQVKFYKDHPLK